MELFYTVISKEGVAQSKALNSLGGFCSSSKVANATLDAVFGEVSSYALQSPQPEYIGLILKNTLSRLVRNIRIWVNTPEGSQCKLRVSAVELSDMGEMEVIPSVNAMPLYADFVEPTFSNPLVIDAEEGFAPQQMMGLWLERSVNTNSEDVLRRNDCDYLYQKFLSGQSAETEEELSLSIFFDYGD